MGFAGFAWASQWLHMGFALALYALRDSHWLQIDILLTLYWPRIGLARFALASYSLRIGFGLDLLRIHAVILFEGSNLRFPRALCGLWKPALEVIFLASHISLQSPLSLEMGYLMFNTSSYSTTLIYTVI